MHTPITEKQIMQLKKGDALLVHGTFRRIFSDGDIGIEVKESNIHTDQHQDNLIYVSPTCVSLPSEPPTLVGSANGSRLFRKGDIVKIIDWNGRKMIDHAAGRTYTVTKDEEPEGYAGVSIKHEENGQLKGWTRVHACNLELVTPVEELERYVVEPGDVAWFVVDKKHESGEQNVVMYMCSLHPNPKAAAEAECDRLNAEYRKEQQ